MNLPLANKNIHSISLKKISLNIGILLKDIFNLKPLNNPLVSCFWVNLDCLLLHTAFF